MDKLKHNVDCGTSALNAGNPKLKLKIHGKTVYAEKGTVLYKIYRENFNKDINGIIAKLNGRYMEFTDTLNESGNFEVMDPSDDVGNMTYIRTLEFVLVKAVHEAFEHSEVIIEHALGKAVYGEVLKDLPLESKDVEKIKETMINIIDRDVPINKVKVSKEKALDIFQSYDMEGKVKLLKQSKKEYVELYELEGRYDYFYGPIAYSTGVLKSFDIRYYPPGFLLFYPDAKKSEIIPEVVQYRKLNRIFIETKKWHNILEISDVGSLNCKVDTRDMPYLIRVAEALHEKKIGYIADMITDRRSVKVVLISGPTSSGKTTFSRRLAIQLGVNGYKPLPISLDDYFVDREHTPKDENGDYDFESIYALDLELFNKHLEMLMKGQEVEIPSFDFKTGCRLWKGRKVKLPNKGIIIIEGIHGLNDILTSAIAPENKFKIYISALTQLNVDNHNRIATTDVRIIRRIVRDYISRGYNAEDTLKMWPSIRKGEEKNIFVFQENADVMFNSTLVYELCVLKKYALEQLLKIKESSSVYWQAVRLVGFLSLFKNVDEELVPDNSILREFIGGSCFYRY